MRLAIGVALICAGLWQSAAGDEAGFAEINLNEARLGQSLFYDRVLSGNRAVSCATCHHPRFATSDGVSLGLGDGGVGLGPDRKPDPENLPEQRIPRNSPALFNLGFAEFSVLFHDGRIEEDPNRPSGLRTPLADEMTVGFSGVLSAQTMFPVLSPDEMAGHYSENDVAEAVRQGRLTGPGGAWDLLAQRVAALDGYAEQFAAVYPEIEAGRPIAFTDISNAIAAFIAFEWRADDSPYDRHLNGTAPLEGAAARGMALFQGDAGCSTCHSGRFQTDHRFHAMGTVQLGPGKAERFESHSRDVGRMRVTGRKEDAYRFRTPSLRNVVHTGPWGHAGAHRDLGAFLRAHQKRAGALPSYDRAQAILADLPGTNDWAVLDDEEELRAIAAASMPPGGDLNAAEIDDLIAFLEALTDGTSLQGRLGIPETVPSGLPVER